MLKIVHLYGFIQNTTRYLLVFVTPSYDGFIP